MKTVNDYLDDLAALSRNAGGKGTDYAIYRMLGVSAPSVITSWRKGRTAPDDAMALKIADALGVEPLEVLAACHAARARDEKTRSAWEKIQRRAAGAAAALVAFAILALPSLPVAASQTRHIMLTYGPDLAPACIPAPLPLVVPRCNGNQEPVSGVARGSRHHPGRRRPCARPREISRMGSSQV